MIKLAQKLRKAHDERQSRARGRGEKKENTRLSTKAQNLATTIALITNCKEMKIIEVLLKQELDRLTNALKAQGQSAFP